MTVYWFYILLFAISVVIDFVKINSTDKFIFFKLFLLVMALFSGLRFNCDADYTSYVEIYQNMPDVNEWFGNLNNAAKKQTYGEPLFVTLCIILKTFGANHQLMFFIISVSTFLVLGSVIWKLSPYPFSSIFLYNGLFFLAGGFTQIRFGLANVLMLYALYQLFNGVYWRYLLFLLLAIGFHVSSAVGILILPLYLIKPKEWFILLLVLIGFVVSFLDLNALIISYFFNIETESSYTSYLGEMDYLTKAPNTILIIYSFVLVFFAIVCKPTTNADMQNYSLLLTVGAMSIFIGGIAIQVNILARFTVILQIVYIVIIPYLLYTMRFKLIAILLIILYTGYKYQQFLNPGGFIRPYQNVLFL